MAPLKNTKAKKTFTLLASALAALTLSAAAAAQPGLSDDNCQRHNGMAQHQNAKGERFKGGTYKGEHRSERRLEQMQRYLELSDAQAAQLKTLFEQHKSEKEEGASPKALHQAMRDLDPTDSDYQNKVNKLIENAQKQMAERMQARATLRQQVYQLLTPEQRSKMELMEQQRHSMGRGHKGRQPSPASQEAATAS